MKEYLVNYSVLALKEISFLGNPRKFELRKFLIFDSDRNKQNFLPVAVSTVGANEIATTHVLSARQDLEQLSRIKERRQ